MLRPLPLVGASLALVLLGCGGGGGDHHGSDDVSSLTISAPSTTVLPGGTIAFTAFVKGDGKVSWSASGGTITSNGLFTAPATQGTVTVTATAGDQSASRAVNVTTGVAIEATANANPPLAIPKSKLFFADAVTGASDKTVLWSVTDATGAAVAGAIAADGTFTAPAVGTYTVTGAAKADPTKTTTATVRVVPSVVVRFSWAGKGDLVVFLRNDVAPNTSANLVSLVDRGFYDGVKIHRTTTVAETTTPSGPGYDIFQWGDPNTKTQSVDTPGIGSGGPGYTIPFEANDLQNVKYSFAMARTNDRNSGGSQVYVNRTDNTSQFSDGSGKSNYVVFGQVTEATTGVADALVRGDAITKATVEAVAP